MLKLQGFTINFPNEDIPISEKREKPEYCRDWAQAIYAYAVNGHDKGIFVNEGRYRENRKYGEGKQDTSIYDNKLNPKSDDEPDKGKYANIQYDVIAVLSMFRNRFVGKFLKNEEDILCRAIDEFADDERSNKMESKWFDIENKNILDQINNQLGIKPGQQSSLPQNRDEFETYYELGGDKLDYETAGEEIIAHDLQCSDVEMVYIQMLLDYFDSKKLAAFVDVDPYTRKTKIKYADIRRLCIEWDDLGTYQNATFFGYYEHMTVADFRKASGADEETVREVATYFNTYQPEPITFESESKYKELGYRNYDSIVIDIWNCCWRGVDTIREDVKISKPRKAEIDKGKLIQVGDDYFKRVATDRDVMVYKCKWVVGTEQIFDWGLLNDQISTDEINRKLPIVCLRLDGLSLCEQLKPIEDTICLNDYKFQNALAIAAPDGYVYDYDALMETTKVIPGVKAVNIPTQRRMGNGDLIMRMNKSGMMEVMRGGNGLPFVQMKGGLGTALTDYEGVWKGSLEKMQVITGISIFNNGTQLSPETSVEQLRLVKAETEESLSIYDSRFRTLKGYLGLIVLCRAQKLIAYDKRAEKSYKSAIGKAAVEAIKKIELSKLSPTEWGVEVVSRPTEADKERIMRVLDGLIAQSGLEGVPNKPSLYFTVERLLEGKNGVLKAERFIALYEKSITDESMKMRQSNMQQQMQIAEQQAKTKSALEVEKEKVKGQVYQSNVWAAAAAKVWEAQMIHKTVDIPTDQRQTAKELVMKSMELAKSQDEGTPPQPNEAQLNPTQQSDNKSAA